MNNDRLAKEVKKKTNQLGKHIQEDHQKGGEKDERSHPNRFTMNKNSN